MERKKLTVFYDMDNTIVEMSKHLVNSYSGRIRSYGAVNGFTEKEIIAKLHQKGLFASFDPIYGSQAVIKKLVKTGYFAGIISQPMINKYCIMEKNYSLRKHFPFINLKNVTYTFDKYLLAAPGRILVDDNIHHLENWEKMGGISVCFIRGYNKRWKGLAIKKHREIFKLLENLEKEMENNG
jgi:5'(3')-deoxyribonucleotidase